MQKQSESFVRLHVRANGVGVRLMRVGVPPRFRVTSPASDLAWLLYGALVLCGALGAAFMVMR